MCEDLLNKQCRCFTIKGASYSLTKVCLLLEDSFRVLWFHLAAETYTRPILTPQEVISTPRPLNANMNMFLQFYGNDSSQGWKCFLCELWTEGAKEYFSSLLFYLFQCIGNISCALYKFSRFTGSQEFCQIFSLHSHTRRLFAGHLFNENAWERNIVFFPFLLGLSVNHRQIGEKHKDTDNFWPFKTTKFRWITLWKED